MPAKGRVDKRPKLPDLVQHRTILDQLNIDAPIGSWHVDEPIASLIERVHLAEGFARRSNKYPGIRALLREGAWLALQDSTVKSSDRVFREMADAETKQMKAIRKALAPMIATRRTYYQIARNLGTTSDVLEQHPWIEQLSLAQKLDSLIHSNLVNHGSTAAVPNWRNSNHLSAAFVDSMHECWVTLTGATAPATGGRMLHELAAAIWLDARFPIFSRTRRPLEDWMAQQFEEATRK